MKKFLLTLAFGSLMAASASAAPIVLTIVGYGGLNAVNFQAGSTAVTLNNSPFNLTCVGSSSGLCGAQAFLTSGPVLSSGAVETFGLGTGANGAGLTFTSNGAAWSVVQAVIPGGFINGFALTGLLTSTVAGFDPTQTTIVFSAQNSSPIVAGQQVTWSAQGNSVPEPGSMALLGSGLLGLGLAARRRLKK